MITGLGYWNDIFGLYTVLGVGLRYIWETFDNISAHALSGDYDSLLL